MSGYTEGPWLSQTVTWEERLQHIADGVKDELRAYLDEGTLSLDMPLRDLVLLGLEAAELFGWRDGFEAGLAEQRAAANRITDARVSTGVWVHIPKTVDPAACLLCDHPTQPCLIHKPEEWDRYTKGQTP